MLEILLLIFLCRAMGTLLRGKGRKPFVFQLGVVVLWVGGELLGGVVAGVVHVIRHGDAPLELGMSAYLYALVGAACGAGLCFLIAHLLPPLQEPLPSPSDYASETAPSPFLAVDPQNPYAATGYVEPELAAKHSGLGIASSIIAVIAGVAAVTLVTLAGIMEVSNPGGINENSPQAMLMGLGIIGAIGLNLLGLCLGIAGLLQTNRSRAVAVVGLVLNALLLLSFGALMAIGLSATA